MSNKRIRVVLTAILVVMLASTVFAAAPAKAQDKVKVGLSFSDFATERWPVENDLLTKLLTEKGYEVLSQQANHDPKLQNDQIDTMVGQGAKAIIVVAEDGKAAVTAVSAAGKAGVKVIAYDRLIPSPDIAAYISFDNVEVGRQQAAGVLAALKIDDGMWTKDNPAKVVQLGGDPNDNNATLFTLGQTETLQKYVDSGVVKIVHSEGVQKWDLANAQKLMENILTAQNNMVDAVVASNDNLGLGAIQALKAQKLSVPVSGQDATAPGCNSIVKGELTVTILKDVRNLAPLAVDLTDKLLKGEKVEGLESATLADLTQDKTMEGSVMSFALPIEQVTKDNVFELVVKTGFQAYDDVYKDIPEADRPAKP